MCYLFFIQPLTLCSKFQYTKLLKNTQDVQLQLLLNSFHNIRVLFNELNNQMTRKFFQLFHVFFKIKHCSYLLLYKLFISHENFGSYSNIVASWLSGRALGLKSEGPDFKSRQFQVYFLRTQNNTYSVSDLLSDLYVHG